MYIQLALLTIILPHSLHVYATCSLNNQRIRNIFFRFHLINGNYSIRNQLPYRIMLAYNMLGLAIINIILGSHRELEVT